MSRFFKQVEDAVTEFGGHNTQHGSLAFQSFQDLYRLREKEGIGSHVDIGGLHIFTLVIRQCPGFGNSRQDGKRFLQRLPDGALDFRIRHSGVPVVAEHMTETSHNAP